MQRMKVRIQETIIILGTYWLNTRQGIFFARRLIVVFNFAHEWGRMTKNSSNQVFMTDSLERCTCREVQTITSLNKQYQ
jgi:hypothetical protein